jgi:hypothetical protein
VGPTPLPVVVYDIKRFGRPRAAAKRGGNWHLVVDLGNRTFERQQITFVARQTAKREFLSAIDRTGARQPVSVQIPSHGCNRTRKEMAGWTGLEPATFCAFPRATSAKTGFSGLSVALF